ncbi:MAG: hypothetical protein N2D54_05515 [Chloroflexota bacterium]
MLDDKNDMDDSSAFLDEIEEADAPPPRKRRKTRKERKAVKVRKIRRPLSKGKSKIFSEMTSFQLFIIAGMSFSSVCIIGFFVMIVTGRMAPPF